VNKQTKIAALAGAGLLAFWLYQRFFAHLFVAEMATLAGKVKLHVKGIKVKNGEVLIGLVFENPTSTTFKIKAITGNFYLDQKLLGHVAQYGNFVIKPTGETLMPVHIVIPLAAVLALIARKLSTNQPKELQFIGLINIDETTYNINKKLLV
jgi:hypothetical protein